MINSTLSEHLPHKKHDQHHHRYMVVPALPQAELVVPHPNLALGVAQTLLDPVTLALLKRETLGRRNRGSIAEAIFDLPGRPDFAAHDKVPAMGDRSFPLHCRP